MTRDQIYERLSQTLSRAMHPFVMPVYAILLLLFGSTFMENIPLKVKLFFLGVVVVNTVMVPALFILLLRGLGYLHSLSLVERRDRIIPLIVVAGCYVVCAYMVSGALSAFFIRKLLVAAAGCVLLGLVVTCFWQISLHMIAAGGVVAMLVLVNVAGFGSLIGGLCVALLLSGALASARLYLGYHNPGQIAAGFLGGFIVASCLLLI